MKIFSFYSKNYDNFKTIEDNEMFSWYVYKLRRV